MVVPLACTITGWSMTAEGGATTTGNLTAGSKLLALTSATGISSSQVVSGAGITAGTTATSQPGPASLALSQAATATGFATLSYSAITTGNTTNASQTVTVASAALLAVGQSVSGTGITGGTVITALAGTTVTLSIAATATGTGVALTFSTTTASSWTTNGDSNLILTAVNPAIIAGQSVTGTGIPVSTTVVSYAAGPAVMISGAATATSTGTALAFKNGATVDVWKVGMGATLHTVSNTVTGLTPPSLTGNVATSSTLTGWTTTVATNDVLAFDVSAVAGNPVSVSIVLGCVR